MNNPLEHIGDFLETLLGLPGKALGGLGMGLSKAFGVCRKCGKSHGGKSHKASTDFTRAFDAPTPKKKTKSYPAPAVLKPGGCST